EGAVGTLQWMACGHVAEAVCHRVGLLGKCDPEALRAHGVLNMVIVRAAGREFGVDHDEECRSVGFEETNGVESHCGSVDRGGAVVSEHVADILRIASRDLRQTRFQPAVPYRALADVEIRRPTAVKEECSTGSRRVGRFCRRININRPWSE